MRNLNIKKKHLHRLFFVLISGACLALYLSQILPTLMQPERLNCANLDNKALPNVVIYGTSWCVYCKRARWFLEDHQVVYCAYDIEKSASAASQYAAAGAQAPPLIMVNGNTMYGFNEEKLTALLQENGLL